MIHECNVYCYSASSDLNELIGKEDDGKWLPFAFDMMLVDAIKMSSDEPDHNTYRCTSVFLQNGESYIIDTKYKDFLKLWKMDIMGEEEENDDYSDNLNL